MEKSVIMNSSEAFLNAKNALYDMEKEINMKDNLEVIKKCIPEMNETDLSKFQNEFKFHYPGTYDNHQAIDSIVKARDYDFKSTKNMNELNSTKFKDNPLTPVRYNLLKIVSKKSNLTDVINATNKLSSLIADMKPKELNDLKNEISKAISSVNKRDYKDTLNGGDWAKNSLKKLNTLAKEQVKTQKKTLLKKPLQKVKEKNVGIKKIHIKQNSVKQAQR